VASANDSDRKLSARIAIETRWANTVDRAAATAPARAAFDAKFPNANARRAHFLKMALKSAQARRARKAGATLMASPPGARPAAEARWNHMQREGSIGDARPDGAA